MNEQLIRRIEAMERRFDTLQKALQEAPEELTQPQNVQMLKELEAYYEGGQWLRDYQADEQSLLPAGLKRGVLSEDGVWNLLDEICQLQKERNDQCN